MSQHPPLIVSKHEKFFRLCLQSFPSKAQSEDSNKLALIYFVLHGLDLLNKLSLTNDERQQYCEVIYQHSIDSPNTRKWGIQAFRSTQTLASDNEYDLPSLSATFFAIVNLLVLRAPDITTRLDRDAIMKFVSRCQNEDGSFSPTLNSAGLPWGEVDLRHCYIACCIRKLLSYDSHCQNDFDVAKLVDFIKSKHNYNGGLSNDAFTESHAGLTFVGLAALKLVGYDLHSDASWHDLTENWLVHRQVDYVASLHSYDDDEQIFDDYDFYDAEDIGGFNGRENKFSDTCYCWWVTGSLSIIQNSPQPLFNVPHAAHYLLGKTQNKLMGGFGKNVGGFPDPFHSYLGLASLALWKQNLAKLTSPPDFLSTEGIDQLQGIDETLVISKSSKEFLDGLTW